MTNLTKYRLCQAATSITLVVAILCLSRMSPWAPPHHNKVFFAVLITDIVVGMGCVIGYYYYRSRIRETNTSGIEVQTLAATAKQPPTQAEASTSFSDQNRK